MGQTSVASGAVHTAANVSKSSSSQCDGAMTPQQQGHDVRHAMRIVGSRQPLPSPPPPHAARSAAAVTLHDWGFAEQARQLVGHLPAANAQPLRTEALCLHRAQR